MITPKKNLGIGDPDSFALKIRVYRTWEIAGTQDTAADTRKIYYPASVFLQYTYYYMLSIKILL